MKSERHRCPWCSEPVYNGPDILICTRSGMNRHKQWYGTDPWYGRRMVHSECQSAMSAVYLLQGYRLVGKD